MPKRLLNPLRTPPGGWHFEDPDTRFKFDDRYTGLTDLMDHVRAYRAHNALNPIPHLRKFIENWLCERANMNGYCYETASRSVGQYVQGAKAALKLKLKGERGFVPPEIAAARAATCIRCPHNKELVQHSRLGRYTDQYVQSLVGARTTPLDNQLRSCAVCTCPLRPKVHFSQDIVQNSLDRSEIVRLPSGMPGLDGAPLYCWQTHPIKLEADDA